MGLKFDILRFKDILSDKYIRLDTKYRIFSDKNKFNIWNIKDTKPLSYYMQPIISNILKKGELDDEYYLIDLKSIERKTNTLIDIEVVNEIGSDKAMLERGDLVVPKLEPKKGQFFLNLNHQKYIGSTELIEYKINLESANPKFLYYILVNNKTLEAMSYMESGKTHRRVQSSDLLKIQIPNIFLDVQNEIVKKIEPIEQEIQNLKLQKKEHLDIINEIFGDELNFDWQEFNRLKNENIFSSSLLDFSNNLDLRFSYKFHNLEHKFLCKFLISKTSKKIKDFISEPIVLGKGISPLLYDDDGEYYYIAMSNIKNYIFEVEDCKKVGVDFYKQNINKSIKINDILLARSGEGTIGKVAIIEDEEVEGIFADFTMRIRLEKYNPTFAYYYFRSDFFQYLVYTHKKGLGNNTNIFPSQIQEFPILDFALEKQKQIVEKIKSKIDSQKLIDEQIEQKQKEISDLIYQCIQEL
ncbi:MAG: hypothetical protein WCR69_09045 [Sulfuricurvum sp.]